MMLSIALKKKKSFVILRFNKKESALEFYIYIFFLFKAMLHFTLEFFNPSLKEFFIAVWT